MLWPPEPLVGRTFGQRSQFDEDQVDKVDSLNYLMLSSPSVGL